MSRRHVRLSPQAREDLDHIADPLHGEVFRRLELLGTYPVLGAALTGEFMGWRSTVVKLFRIVYRVGADGQVDVGYIRHCRRSPPPPLDC